MWIIAGSTDRVGEEAFMSIGSDPFDVTIDHTAHVPVGAWTQALILTMAPEFTPDIPPVAA
jgi:hypothetical protein